MWVDNAYNLLLFGKIFRNEQSEMTYIELLIGYLAGIFGIVMGISDLRRKK